MTIVGLANGRASSGKNHEQDILDRLAAKLHEDAMNYSVFLHVYEIEAVSSKDAQTVIRHALRTEAARLGGIVETLADSVWPEIEVSLLYQCRFRIRSAPCPAPP
jgi:hypothetical protein